MLTRLGESFGAWTMGDDAGVMPWITSANIACGFHAGDFSTMRQSVLLAKRHGVAIGAHVSLPDLQGFGRRAMKVSPDEAHALTLYQIGALSGFARAADLRVAHVKPHGALYNRVVHDERQARAVVDAVRHHDPELVIVGLPGSRLLALAEEAGIPTVREAFVDRGYRPDGTLVPRGEPGSLVTSPVLAGERAVRIATEGKVVAVDGTVIDVPAESLCVHSDTPGSVQIASAVRSALAAAGVEVAAFRSRLTEIRGEG